MKNSIIYIISALLIGLLLGFLIFDNTSNVTAETHNHSTEDNQMWTCSMHPQIMQPEPGDCPICGMELIPAENGAEALDVNEVKMTPNAMALANIQTTTVQEGVKGEESSITLSGKIKSNEEMNAVQASYFEGRIEKLYINFTGDRVRKGQLLATIYAPSLVNAQQELITTASMKESQPELYKAVRNKLKLWKLSESQINQIESSGKIREVFPVYATVSGTVSQKMADEGDYVTKGQPILKVNNLNSVWAIFDAYENQISALKVGDPITVTTNAYPEKKYKAKISFIDPILDVDKRTIAIRATLDNSNGLLKPGMFVSGSIEQKYSNNISKEIQLPASAVMWTGKRSLVYVKTNPNEPIFEMRNVTIAKRIGDMYTITEGLTSGDEVVVNGTFTVDAAAQLQGKKSMMMQSTSSVDAQNNKHEKLKVSSDFQQHIEKLFNNYIKLKDALVADKPQESKSSAETFEKYLKHIDAKELEQKMAKKHWSTIQKGLQKSIHGISNSTEIDQQREHFIQLSKAMTHAVEMFGVNQTVFNLYCPMADKDQGAYWLSKEKEIRNPYFGQAMLKCGEVKEEIK